MGMGLLISGISRTQRQAQQLSAVLNLLSMLLTGFIYPLTTMPLWAQLLGEHDPADLFHPHHPRDHHQGGRACQFLWGDALSLVVYACVVLALAAAVMKTRLD